MTEDDEIVEAMARALETSMTALGDWLLLYADDVCPEADVAEARQRVGKFGTIGYIAITQEQNRAALRAYRDMMVVL